MKMVVIYLVLFLVTFIVSSIIAHLEDGYLGDILLVSALNIVYLIMFVGYRLLEKMAMTRAEKLLGYKPKTVGDFHKLGIEDIDLYRTPRNLLRILIKSKEVAE